MYAVSLVLVAVAMVFYINYVQRQSDQRWCSVMATLDDAYSSGTPTTPIGVKLARDIKTRHRELHCPRPTPTPLPAPGPTR